MNLVCRRSAAQQAVLRAQGGNRGLREFVPCLHSVGRVANGVLIESNTPFAILFTYFRPAFFLLPFSFCKRHYCIRGLVLEISPSHSLCCESDPSRSFPNVLRPFPLGPCVDLSPSSTKASPPCDLRHTSSSALPADVFSQLTTLIAYLRRSDPRRGITETDGTKLRPFSQTRSLYIPRPMPVHKH